MEGGTRSELDLMLLRSGTAVDHSAANARDTDTSLSPNSTSSRNLASPNSMSSPSSMSSEWHAWQWSPRTHYTYADPQAYSDDNGDVPMPHMARYPIVYYSDQVQEQRRRRTSLKWERLERARRRISFEHCEDRSLDSGVESQESFDEEQEVVRIFKHVHTYIKRFYTLPSNSSDYFEHSSKPWLWLQKSVRATWSLLLMLLSLSASFGTQSLSILSKTFVKSASVLAFTWPKFSLQRMLTKTRSVAKKVRSALLILIPLLLFLSTLLFLLKSDIRFSDEVGEAISKSKEALISVPARTFKAAEKYLNDFVGVSKGFGALVLNLTLNSWSASVNYAQNVFLSDAPTERKLESTQERRKSDFSYQEFISKLEQELDRMAMIETEKVRQGIINNEDFLIKPFDMEGLIEPACPECSSIVNERLHKWQLELDQIVSSLNGMIADLNERLKVFEERVQIDMAEIQKLIESIPVGSTPCASGMINETRVNQSRLLEYTRRLVQSQLAVYDADKTGRFDYALESSGGSVISIRCTESLVSRTTVYALFGVLPLWFSADLKGGPRSALSPDLSPGNCWAFKGAIGYLVVELSRPIVIEAFVIEHTPLKIGQNSSLSYSAPRRFDVYGLRAEFDEEPHLFGEYTYDGEGPSLQNFPVHRPSEEHFSIVELKILSNHNNSHAYTCLYRFRVHGRP